MRSPCRTSAASRCGRSACSLALSLLFGPLLRGCLPARRGPIYEGGIAVSLPVRCNGGGGGMTIGIRVLGRCSVRRDGVEIPAGAFRGRLVRSLVRMLVTRRGSFVSRDLLIEALWPAGAPADPDLNLNVLVTRARNALGAPSLILTGPGGYSFAGTDACSVDAELFLELVAAGRMTDALARWGGEPLEEDAYAGWAQEYRDRLNRSHLEALEGAAAAALAAGVPARAVAWARLAVAEAPLREASYLVLARALAASRDTAGALQVLAGLRGKLAEDLGLDPSDETRR